MRPIQPSSPLTGARLRRAMRTRASSMCRACSRAHSSTARICRSSACTVRSISRQEGGDDRYVVLTTAVDFAHIEDVLIMIVQEEQ